MVLFVIGIDMALISNGYVYHTSHDLLNTIPLGTYQNVGDNVLSLAKAFAGYDFPVHANEEPTDVSIYTIIH